MAIYLVTPLAKNADAVASAIKAVGLDSYTLPNGAGFLISHKGTSVEASNDLGITGHQKGERSRVGSALITPVVSYYGIGSSDMWEWIKTRIEAGA